MAGILSRILGAIRPNRVPLQLSMWEDSSTRLERRTQHDLRKYLNVSEAEIEQTRFQLERALDETEALTRRLAALSEQYRSEIRRFRGE